MEYIIGICVFIIIIWIVLDFKNLDFNKDYINIPKYRIEKDERLNGEIRYYIQTIRNRHNGWVYTGFIIEDGKIKDDSFYRTTYWYNYDEAKYMLEKIIEQETKNYLARTSKKVSIVLESKIEKK